MEPLAEIIAMIDLDYYYSFDLDKDCLNKRCLYVHSISWESGRVKICHYSQQDEKNLPYDLKKHLEY